MEPKERLECATSNVEQGLIGPWFIGLIDRICSSKLYEIPDERACFTQD
jgi:hypothetical protein